jgi:hypothetical protein
MMVIFAIKYKDYNCITILTQLNRQKEQSFRSFITFQKVWFSSTSMSTTISMTQINSLILRGIFQGQILKSSLKQ